MSLRLPVSIVLALLAGTGTAESYTESSGYVGADVRSFTNDGQWVGQDYSSDWSVLVQPEFRWEDADARDQFTFVGFMRKDSEDDSRSHFDLREANWFHRGDKFDVRLGVGKVFWGVTESRHLVNIINQIDLLEDVTEEDYLGQPLVNIETQRKWGLLSVYFLPFFREREHPGKEGRLRFPFPVDDDRSDVDDEGVNFALRWSHYTEGWDLGLHYFYGTSREPTFEFDPDTVRLLPVYDKINQAGADIQYTSNAWLWKFEGIVREGHGDTFTAVVGGFEYTYFQIGDSKTDLGVLVEYLRDGRDDLDAPGTVFDNDLFIGTRMTFNNVQDSSILAGGSIDLEDGSTALRIEVESRIGDSWRLELNLQTFVNVDDDNVAQAFAEDDYAELKLLWYY